jgi:gamma-glutamyl phosphate reductase
MKSKKKMIKEVRDNMDSKENRKILGNSMMAHTNMSINIDTKSTVDYIFNILFESEKIIKNANELDIKNNNGFEIDFSIIKKIKKELSASEDIYRKVLSMNKNENNYLEGRQIDNLGTIGVIYSGNTYIFLELALKSILSHNSIIFSCNKYMRGTNELIIILIQRALKEYKIDENLVQADYSGDYSKLLENNMSINKVIVIGDRKLQNNVKKQAKTNLVCKGYDNYDIYIEDLTNISLIEQIIKQTKNVDIYIQKDLINPFDEAIKVEDIDEAIGQINFNTTGYSSAIFTDNSEKGSQFLREIKSENISVNASPLLNKLLNLDIGEMLFVKNMYFPSPLTPSNEKNKIEMKNSVLTDVEIKQRENENKIIKINEEHEKLKIESQKNIENLQRQLKESQNIANKYMGIFNKSYFSRIFAGLKKQDLERDKKMLS